MFAKLTRVFLCTQALCATCVMGNSRLMHYYMLLSASKKLIDSLETVLPDIKKLKAIKFRPAGLKQLFAVSLQYQLTHGVGRAPCFSQDWFCCWRAAQSALFLSLVLLIIKAALYKCSLFLHPANASSVERL